MTTPTRDPSGKDERRCSFCGRRRSDVQRMFRSEDARICEQCVLKFRNQEN